MAHDVFISHSAQDKAIADAVCHGLEQAGVRCWIAPRDIQPGLPWAAAIAKAVRSSRVLVLVFSGAADRSEHVRREVGAALDAGAAIIPFRLEHVKAGDELNYYLSGLHWLDATTPPLAAHVSRLAETVKGVLGEPDEERVARSAPIPSGSGAAGERPRGRFSWPIAVAASAFCGLFIVAMLAWVAVSGQDSPERGADAPASDVASPTVEEVEAVDPTAEIGEPTVSGADEANDLTEEAVTFFECRSDGVSAPAGGRRRILPHDWSDVREYPDGQLFGLPAEAVAAGRDGELGFNLADRYLGSSTVAAGYEPTLAAVRAVLLPLGWVETRQSEVRTSFSIPSASPPYRRRLEVTVVDGADDPRTRLVCSTTNDPRLQAALGGAPGT